MRLRRHECITMNMPLRNFPKPPLVIVYADCGLSERTEIVAQLCNRTNEVLEYVMGLEYTPVLVPAQGNVDARMPLYFMRPCVEAINKIILTNGLEVPMLAKPGDSMDYHRFVPLAREIAEALNAIIDLL